MSFISKKYKFIFLSPPKTGSTSLKWCLKASKILVDPVINIPNHLKQHLLLSEILKTYDIKMDELNQYKIIQIVRNPYDRFVSAVYQHNIMTKKNYTISEYLEKLNKYFYLLPNNEDLFYEKFYEIPLHKVNELKYTERSYSLLWFKQEWWNDVGADVNYFRLESVRENLAKLSEFLNIKLSDFQHVRPFESNRNNKYEKYFDETTRIHFENLYISDVKKFNYEFYNPSSKMLI